jgi:hypothetical protein
MAEWVAVARMGLGRVDWRGAAVEWRKESLVVIMGGMVADVVGHRLSKLRV